QRCLQAVHAGNVTVGHSELYSLVCAPAGDWRAVTSPTPTPAVNIELVRAGFADFNAGDLDACVARLGPAFVINLAELPEPMHGRDTWRYGAETMRRAFPDITADLRDAVAAE